jgi:ABC-type thiamine transport system ATPase subunit
MSNNFCLMALSQDDVAVLSPGGKGSSALMRGLAGFMSRVKASESMAF